MKKKDTNLVSCKLKKSMRIAVAILCVASVIYVFDSSVKIENTFAAENGDEIRELGITGYNIDDVRDLLGYSRKYGNEARYSIIKRASRLNADEEQLTEIKAVTGDFGESAETYIDMLMQSISDYEHRYRDSMSHGYNVNTVVMYYKEAAKCIDKYETATNKKWGSQDNIDDSMDRVMEDLQVLKAGMNRNVEVGNNLGFGLEMPVKSVKISRAFDEMNNEKIQFRSQSMNKEELTTPFNGIITYADTKEVKKGEDTASSKVDVITISTGDDLEVTFEGAFTFKAKKGDSVKQGDVIAVIDENCIFSMAIKLDNKYVDPLLIYGANGAILLNAYINESVDYTGKGYDVSAVKNIPSEDIDFGIDGNTIETELID